MDKAILLVAVFLVWTLFFHSIYQGIVIHKKWFARPPSGFGMIAVQNRSWARLFMLLSVLFFVAGIVALFLDWNFPDTRVHILGGLICFGIAFSTPFLGYSKDIRSLADLREEVAVSNHDRRRMKRVRVWSLVRSLWIFFSAIFVSIAFNHL